MNRTWLVAVFWTCTSLVTLASLSVRAEEHPAFSFVARHCIACHAENGAAEEMNLNLLREAATLEAQRDVWELVAEKVRTHEMPPPGEPQPDPEEALAFVHWLRDEFQRQDLATEPRAGRVTARRLNRAETIRTLRDLLGVDVEPTESFPADPAAYGFDNISDALRLSPVLLEKYLDTAELAVRTALFGPPHFPAAVTHYPVPVRINTPRGQIQLPDDLTHYDETGLSTVHSAHVVHRFPVAGEYQFRLVLNGHRPNQSEPARPALYVDGRLIDESEIDATDLEGQVIEFRAWVPAGEHLVSASYLKNYHGLPASYGGPEPSQRPDVPLLSNNARGKLTAEDIEILRKYGTRLKTDAIEARVDNRYESISIGGPLRQEVGPNAASRALILGADFPGQELSEETARAILARFLPRAFRRPAAENEISNYLALFREAWEDVGDYEEAIAIPLQAILIAPDFLYRIERDIPVTEFETEGDAEIEAGVHAVPIGEFELASRLSYFLWSSMPDDELFALAGEGRLREPEVWEGQVLRMLRDGKSRALAENFAGQWLQFRNVELANPDLEQFPEFDEGLRRSMRRETEHFFHHLLREDRPIVELLDADYTFLDERLARFLGVPGVEGPEFRLVDMSGTRRGGGILSHASILTLTSYSTRTSPVLRGKWILETLLHAPPPPPPPSVPELEESQGDSSLSLREQLEIHRRDPACSSCHARMDPLGFGLEHFSAIGAWRDQEGERPVDAAGTLPGGRSFQGHEGLKAILLEERDALIQGLAENLLVYALGRGLEPFDRPALREIASAAAAEDARFSTLVLGVVNSLPFQMRSVGDTVADSGVTGSE